MIQLRSLGFAALVTASLFAAAPREAEACGGCFVQQSENTQVSGHRMVLSLSAEQTTLWDQITYDGDPSEFAWVLPIKGEVDLGVSSDLLFGTLESNTSVFVSSPQINCPTGNCGPTSDGGFGSATGTGGGGEPPVNVIAQEVVGPYDTVQLQSSDPAALTNWLTSRGYNIPEEIQPVIAAYVNEGFDFLALRLIPGQGISAMKPIRVTTPGGAPALPLRMVAAGTGATTPISLWVLAEGRYQPQNFPVFEIGESELVWNWDTSSSNYAELRTAGFAATNGAGWLLDAAEPVGSWVLQSLVDTAQYDPENSGYADENGANAVSNAEDDVTHLLQGIDESSLWISHMYAELARPALGTDLALEASADQDQLPRYFEVQTTVGEAPACPPPPDCGEDDFSVGSGDPFGDGTGGSSGGLGTSSCAAAPGVPRGASTFAFVALGLAALGLRRRR